MGTITETTSTIGKWLDKIDATRSALIASAKGGNRVAAAFAMADARCDLIESLADQTIRAKLLRITDPALAMVELANNPNDEDRIRVCAIAILSGFTPGEDQFAVFGGGFDKRAGKPIPGKLYVKERGFRILFSHLGIVPEVRTSHPEFVEFGTAGKKIWKVSGSATCDYQGEVFTVDFSGDEQLGIPGYETDNVAGIAAKARRRILQALWVKVSPVFASEIDEDDLDSTPVAAPARIDVAVTSAAISTAGTVEAFESSRLAINKRLSKDPGQAAAFADLWKAAAEAPDKAALRGVWQEIVEAKTLFESRDIDELRRWCNYCSDQKE